MCVLAVAWRAHPRWQLVLAGNRDELHARPTAPLAQWEDPPGLLAGKDLKSGGTWLGLSQQGRVGVVTNLRGFGAAEPGLPSRGVLLRDMLAGDGAYSHPADSDLARFNPFNLMILEPDTALFLSNRPAIRRNLAPGLYGLANGALDAPWAKTVRLKDTLGRWLNSDQDDPSLLLDGLGDDRAAESPTLDDPGSPIFVKNPVYGTRSSTVIAIDRAGAVMIERRFDAEGRQEGESRFTHPLPQWDYGVGSE